MRNESRQCCQVIARQLKPICLATLPENPLISVLTANYNYGAYLADAIESLQGQTYGNWEMIVCDDGSTDNSVEVAERYARHDHRIKLLRKENSGMASALNAAHAQARGYLVALLDADDTCSPRRLESALKHMRMQPDAGTLVHGLKFVDRSGKRLGGGVPSSPLSQGWLAPGLVCGRDVWLPPASGLVFRREIADAIFPIPERFRRNADGVLRERAAVLAPVAASAETLGAYRVHGRNLTGVGASVTVREIEKDLATIQDLFDAFSEFVCRVHRISPELIRRSRKAEEALLLSKALLSGERLRLDEIPHEAGGVFRRLLWRVLFGLPRRVAMQAYVRHRRHAVQKLMRRRNCYRLCQDLRSVIAMQVGRAKAR